MKQHITVEQLNELSEEAKMKLGSKHIFKLGDFVHFKNGNGEVLLTKYTWRLLMGFSEEAVPLLSIGQMIEFLDQRFRWGAGCTDLTRAYTARVINKSGYTTYYGDSFCDALWEAVKHVLNEEEKKPNKKTNQDLYKLRSLKHDFTIAYLQKNHPKIFREIMSFVEGKSFDEIMGEVEEQELFTKEYFKNWFSFEDEEEPEKTYQEGIEDTIEMMMEAAELGHECYFSPESANSKYQDKVIKVKAELVKRIPLKNETN